MKYVTPRSKIPGGITASNADMRMLSTKPATRPDAAPRKKTRKTSAIGSGSALSFLYTKAITAMAGSKAAMNNSVMDDP